MKSTYQVHETEYNDDDSIRRQAGAGITVTFDGGNRISASVPTPTIAELASELINQFASRTPHEFHQFVRTLDNAVFYAAIEHTDELPEPALENGDLTDAQAERLRYLCEQYGVEFNPDHYTKEFDLPEGWVQGWIGGPNYSERGAANRRTIYVGVDPQGASHS